MSGFHKMATMRPPLVIKQIENGQVTSILLDGVGKKRGQALLTMGCVWLRGPHGGCWQITPEVAEKFIARGVEVYENRLS